MPPAAAMSFMDVLVNAFPTSIVDAMARGDVLQIVVFCFLFGVACLSVGEKARPVLELADAVVTIAGETPRGVDGLAPRFSFVAAEHHEARAGALVLTHDAAEFVAVW